MLVGESRIVQAVIEPDDASIKDVTWESSNEEIATVDEAGEIFALSTGKCKITATSKDGNNVSQDSYLSECVRQLIRIPMNGIQQIPVLL